MIQKELKPLKTDKGTHTVDKGTIKSPIPAQTTSRRPPTRLYTNPTSRRFASHRNSASKRADASATLPNPFVYV